MCTAEKIANELIDTCYTLDQVLDKFELVYEDLPPVFFTDLDRRARCCEMCNWWTESVDQFGYCDDCAKAERAQHA